MNLIQFIQDNSQLHRRAMITLVMLGLLAITVFRYVGSELDLNQKIINESSIVTSNISASILFKDSEEIRRIHESILFSKEIVLSCLYDKENKLISIVQNKNSRAKNYCGYAKDSSPMIFLYKTDIQFKNNPIGSIEIFVTRQEIIYESIIFFMAASFIALLIWLINDFSIKRLSVELKSYESQLQELISRRDNIIQDEHRRIAIEIHDQIGQLLSSANFNIRYLRNANNSIQINELLDNTENILNQVYAGIKNISKELHPSVLDFGIQAAIEWLAENRLTPQQIEWKIKRNQGFRKINDNLSIVLFKITQEAFTNILRHSHATFVSIQLHSSQKVIKLEIKDNGIGIAKQSMRKGKSLGLIGIAERAKAVGGKAEITADRSGTTLLISLPSQENEHV